MRNTLRYLVLLMCLRVAACKSAEDRAEAHVQRGVGFAEAGDAPRAMIELRNALHLIPAHHAARQLLLRLEERQGNAAAAYGHARALTDADPSDLDALRDAARLAATLRDWDAAHRHVTRAKTLGQSDDPVLQSVSLAIAYQSARRTADQAALDTIADTASGLLQRHPDLHLVRAVLIDAHVAQQDWPAARQHLDISLRQQPAAKPQHMLRLAVLEQMEDAAEIDRQLRHMLALFPDDDAVMTLMVRWHLSRGDNDVTADFLRRDLARTGHRFDRGVRLVNLAAGTYGAKAGLAEIDHILAELPVEAADRPLYQTLRAGLLFDLGHRARAIMDVKTILAAPHAPDQTSTLKTVLARLYVETGRPDAARALVDDVLAADPDALAALKMRARWQLDSGQPDGALVALRRALGRAPHDTEILTLMAEAQMLAGRRDLAGEMLALAARRAPGSDPGTAIRHALFLADEGRLVAAEDSLVDALDRTSGNPALLGALGRVYVLMRDWDRVQEVANALARSKMAIESATQIPVGMAPTLARNTEAAWLALYAAIRETDEGPRADALLETALGALPHSRNLQWLQAGRLQEQGNIAAAITAYDRLYQIDPDAVLVANNLASLLSDTAQPDRDLRRAHEVARTLRGSPVPEFQDTYGWILSQRGAAPEALDHLQPAARALPGNAVVQYHLAVTYARAGQHDAALDAYRTAARLGLSHGPRGPTGKTRDEPRLR